MDQGFFITFEGPEAAGKSTQITMLERHLKGLEYDITLTREPGGSPLAEKLRHLLKHDVEEEIDPVTDLFLFGASRRQHVKQVIKPALDKGRIVISDRYMDSTTAYQGHAGDVDLPTVEKVNRIASCGIIPDITFYIRIPLTVIDFRLKGRSGDKPDREDYMDKDYHEAVICGYDTIARQNTHRVVIIDGLKSPEDIHEEILKYLAVELDF